MCSRCKGGVRKTTLQTLSSVRKRGRRRGSRYWSRDSPAALEKTMVTRKVLLALWPLGDHLWSAACRLGLPSREG